MGDSVGLNVSVGVKDGVYDKVTVDVEVGVADGVVVNV